MGRFKRLIFRLVPLTILVALIVSGVRLSMLSNLDISTTGPVAGWDAYGADAGGTRYSPLTQITPRNVWALKEAWVYQTGENYETYLEGRYSGKAAFEATPILVNGVMYFTTPSTRLIALDPETGEEQWVFDPEVDMSFSRSEMTSRGVSAYIDPENSDEATLFLPTADARLIAIDAATGLRRNEFGNNGEIDLSQGIGEVNPSRYTVTSPPAVVKGTVIVGSAIADNGAVDLERGVVRAYDAVTGELAWSWDPIPKSSADPAYAEWTPNAAGRTGGANAWSILSADLERGIVYIPTGSASPDYYGGERLGDNRYANSIVALKAETGEMLWHFQVVHHDLWDYDVPAQPMLIDVVRDGKTIPAVVQATKMGLLFFFNRVTGEPLFPIEERPVPQTDVDGEVTSATQPFPTLPLPLAPHTLTPDDAWGPFGLGKGGAKKRIASLRSEGIYTPPSIGGTIMYPGNAGGTNWGSIAFDKDRNILIVNSSHVAFETRLILRDDFDSVRENSPGPEYAPQRGTPYGMSRDPMVSSLGLPVTKPPWGTIAGIDVNTGERLWESTLGTIRDLAAKEVGIPVPLKWGTPNLGGPIVTASGLTFIAATMDNYLRAFETATGREIWKGRLPAGGQATPMTYRLREEGKQYVVICAGGHGRLGTKLGDYVVAYALPDPPRLPFGGE